MKTSILDELILPEDVQAIARREALRTKRPVNEVLKEWVLATARTLNANAQPVADAAQAA